MQGGQAHRGADGLADGGGEEPPAGVGDAVELVDEGVDAGGGAILEQGDAAAGGLVQVDADELLSPQVIGAGRGADRRLAPGAQLVAGVGDVREGQRRQAELVPGSDMGVTSHLARAAAKRRRQESLLTTPCRLMPRPNQL